MMYQLQNTTDGHALILAMHDDGMATLYDDYQINVIGQYDAEALPEDWKGAARFLDAEPAAYSVNLTDGQTVVSRAGEDA